MEIMAVEDNHTMIIAIILVTHMTHYKLLNYANQHEGTKTFAPANHAANNASPLGPSMYLNSHQSNLPNCSPY